MAYIPSMPLKQPTKKEAIALAKKFHKETIKLLKMMDRIDKLSKRKQKNPMRFAFSI
jgi:hypothetical protein